VLFPLPLWMGMTQPILKPLGTTPDASDRFMRWAIGDASTSTPFYSTDTGMPSSTYVLTPVHLLCHQLVSKKKFKCNFYLIILIILIENGLGSYFTLLYSAVACRLLYFYSLDFTRFFKVVFYVIT
jgi:hypothetical protein